MEELPDFADYFVRWIAELDAGASR
jgi:hypothetical protein